MSESDGNTEPQPNGEPEPVRRGRVPNTVTIRDALAFTIPNHILHATPNGNDTTTYTFSKPQSITITYADADEATMDADVDPDTADAYL